MKSALIVAALFTPFLLAPAARADDLPKGLADQKPASAGKTDVAKEGFEGATKPEDDKDASQAEISAGGLVASGNSKQMALTSAGKVRIRRDKHQFTGAAAANFARAAAPDAPDQGMQTTVENLQGRVRYDYFFAKHWSLFAAVTGRRDRFQGLDLRLNVDPGLAYYVIDEAKQQLSLEGGYDLQYDIRRDDEIAAALASGEDVKKTEVRHSGRAFAGYENKLNERVSGSLGMEYIQSVQNSTKWRLTWDASLASNIVGKFSTAVTINVRYDHEPLPGVEKTDVMTSFNLVYGLL